LFRFIETQALQELGPERLARIARGCGSQDLEPLFSP
jgi:hypothetical protein